jgi:arylsulfatase
LHSPHHAPDSYLDKYKGRFNQGWDKTRDMILANQKRLGIVPQNTKMSARIKEIPEWDSLDAQHKTL